MPNAQPEDFGKTPEHHPIPPAINQIACVRKFMQIGGQKSDVFDVKQAGFYIGMQLEELREQLKALMEGAINGFEGFDQHSELFQAWQWMGMAAEQFKTDVHHGLVLRADREELLDGFLDSAWVSFGGALSYSHDTEAAFREVNRANMDKFPGGVAQRDANGKIMKPVGWRGPNLTPFVRSKEEDK